MSYQTDRQSLLIAVGGAVSGVLVIVLYVYADGTLGFFQNMWTSVVIGFFSAVAVAGYAMIDGARSRKQQPVGLSDARISLLRAAGPLSGLLLVIVVAGSIYKYSVVSAERTAHPPLTAAELAHMESVERCIHDQMDATKAAVPYRTPDEEDYAYAAAKRYCGR